MSGQTSLYRRDLTENFPDSLTISIGGFDLRYEKTLMNLPDGRGGRLESGLRYGENPDQPAALYRLVNGNLVVAGARYVGPGDALISALGLAGSEIHGSRKHPSKTNLTDVDSALGILRWLDRRPAAVIVKHNNPSGAAWGSGVAEAFHKAFEADRVAAFGGALVVNRPLDLAAAELMGQRYMEVVAAPDFEEGVIGSLIRRPDLRIFKLPAIGRLARWRALHFLDIKSLMDGGLIIQRSALNRVLGPEDLAPARAESGGRTIVSVRPPTPAEAEDLVFGWAVEQGVISNSVLFVKDGATVGIGCGQQDRVGVVEIAAFKARRNLSESIAWEHYRATFEELGREVAKGARPQESLAVLQAEVEERRGGLRGSSMVSDAFFPFRDAVDKAIAQKVSAIAHPGGSLRDFEGIEAANSADPPVAMVFTGQRAFRH